MPLRVRQEASMARAARQSKRELERKIERERREREARLRRAGNYQARVWRDHVITTGHYKGDKVPAAVLLKMREARSAHLRSDLSTFDPSSDLGPTIATFPYKSKRQDAELMWCVHACGSVTIQVTHDDADDDLDF
jgi:hypothetical protein